MAKLGAKGKRFGVMAPDGVVYFPAGRYVIRTGEWFNLDLGKSISEINRRPAAGRNRPKAGKVERG